MMVVFGVHTTAPEGKCPLDNCLPPDNCLLGYSPRQLPSIIIATEKNWPRIIVPGSLSPGKTAPHQIIAPRTIAPRIIAHWMIAPKLLLPDN